jgi:nucleoside-diphosphate-sugar epimerase
MRIVITGAAGNIASQLVEELRSSHELSLIDRSPVPDRPSIIADLKKRPPLRNEAAALEWENAFKGADAVVHLAANLHATASWPEVLGDNIEATWNVLEAAAAHHVPRVVFASSNWAVKALELKLAPNCYRSDGPKIGSDIAPCPVNPYGLSKAFGEYAGRTLVDQSRLTSFVAVRIGYYNSAPKEEAVLANKELASLWVGAKDMRMLLRRCVEVSFDGFHVVYGVSAQRSAPYDLNHTEALLSWKPRQLLRK